MDCSFPLECPSPPYHPDDSIETAWDISTPFGPFPKWISSCLLLLIFARASTIKGKHSGQEHMLWSQTNLALSPCSAIYQQCIRSSDSPSLSILIL